MYVVCHIGILLSGQADGHWLVIIVAPALGNLSYLKCLRIQAVEIMDCSVSNDVRVVYVRIFTGTDLWEIGDHTSFCCGMLVFIGCMQKLCLMMKPNDTNVTTARTMNIQGFV